MTAAPFEFFDLSVLRAVRVSPGFVRVTLGGPSLRRFVSGGRDQRVKLFLPHPGAREVAVPRGEGERWWPAWQRMAPDERAIMRTYTLREHRPGRGGHGELDIDFALHGDTGPACRWAGTARPGTPVTLLGPVEADNAGIDFRPPGDTDAVVITGDATALPAVAGILAWLPANVRVRAWLEVAHTADRQPLPTRADAEITWLCRDRLAPLRAAATSPLVDAVRGAALPGAAPYAWLAGEAATVQALRQHLVNDRGIDRARVTFTGYWRRGTTEDDLIEEAIAAAAA